MATTKTAPPRRCFTGSRPTTRCSGYASCSLPDYSSNSYAYSELPFSQAKPNTAATNSFLAMMLTDTNLAAAENTLYRSVAADGSFPTQTVYLAKTDDDARNVRFVEFDNSVFENQVAGNYAVTRIDTDLTAFTNLFGLQTGLGNFSLATNAFVPGSLGDSLTSLWRIYFGKQRADDVACLLGGRGRRQLWHRGGTLQLDPEISRPRGLFLSDARLFTG